MELNINGTEHFVMQDTTILSSQTEPEELRMVQLTAGSVAIKLPNFSYSNFFSRSPIFCEPKQRKRDCKFNSDIGLQLFEFW